ncbi:carboxyl-terminal processing protease [Nakamurella sp. UYEF19]|uniref:S41 family peptidase n=1 Tax=Nakamurella sp. UYEF19 TaxID=1756392 RepID=UPI0033943C0E
MLPGLRSDVPMTMVVPTELEDMMPLLTAEKAEFEAAIGVSVTVTAKDPGHGPRWRMSMAPTAEPTLEWDPQTQQLRSTAAGPDGLLATMSLLHTVVRSGGREAADRPARDRSGVIERVTAEITGSFPALEQRGFAWKSICAEYAPPVRHAVDPLATLQAWTAQLRDVHTWVHSTTAMFHPPYAVSIDGSAATLVRIPAGSAAHEAGARAGWTLVDERPAEWSARSGAPAHAAALVAGRRLLATPFPNPRVFIAQSPGGGHVTWTERPAPATTTGPLTSTGPATVSWRRLSRASGYLRISSWTDPINTSRRIDAALESLTDCELLVVDLRGNAGGNLALATSTRDRFLRAETALGTIRYSTGTGQLGERQTLHGRPPSDDSRGNHWRGEVVVLTDGLTCSASEDFLLGLQGLPHVLVAGEPSCGGSGRPRSMALTHDTRLTISCALTYDREGRCVEGNGLPVDIPYPAFNGDGPLDQDALVTWVQR